MDDARFGRVVRAVRRRLRQRQTDVAEAAGVDQSTVSRLERGRLEEVGLPALRRICATLGITVDLVPRWRGGELARLLDSEHAALVEQVVRELQAAGWQTLVEYTFARYGERGSADVIGWHETRATLLIVEVKARLLDQQDTLSGLDRKRRIVPGLLARERGWRAATVGTLLVVPETTFDRGVVKRHEATFQAALPERTREVRRWLKMPHGPLRGILFLRDMRRAHGKRRPGGPERIRQARDGR